MANVNAKDAAIAVNGSYSAAIDFVGQLLAGGVLEVEGDLVEDATSLIADLAKAFTAGRLALTAEVVADYPEAPRGGGARRSGGGQRRSSGGGGRSTTSTDPASDKQVAFIRDLLESKDHDLDVSTDSLTKAEAASTIEKLLALPDIG